MEDSEINVFACSYKDDRYPLFEKGPQDGQEAL